MKEIADIVLFENFDKNAVIGLIGSHKKDFPLTFPRWECKMEYLDEEAGQDFYKYAASSIQGWRDHFEDTHICQAGNFQGKDSFFAVFDGHGGAECAKYCKENLVSQIPDYGKTNNFTRK